MVKDRGHARADRLDQGHIGRHPGHIPGQVAIDVPPRALEHTHKIDRIVPRDGQAAGEGRIDVVMGVDKAGQDDPAPRVDGRGVRMLGAQRVRLPDGQNGRFVKDDRAVRHHRAGRVTGHDRAAIQNLFHDSTSPCFVQNLIPDLQQIEQTEKGRKPFRARVLLNQPFRISRMTICVQ